MAFSLWLSAENMIRIGLMETSLSSDNAMVRRVAEAELVFARSVMMLGSATLAVGGVFLPRLVASRAYARLIAPGYEMTDEYARFMRCKITPSAVILLGATLLILLYIRFGAALFPESVLWQINGEDGVLETASALLLLMASVLSASVALRIGRQHQRFRCHTMLAVLFFMMFGEEISWGQRIFGFSTPEGLATINVQNEVNLHNMFGYVFDHLFIVGFLVWAAAVPLLYHAFLPFRKLFLSVGLPVPSVGLAVAMTAAALMIDPVVYRFLDPLPTLRLAEARETLSALSFFLLTWEVSRHFPARAGANQRFASTPALKSSKATQAPRRLP